MPSWTWSNFTTIPDLSGVGTGVITSDSTGTNIIIPSQNGLYYSKDSGSTWSNTLVGSNLFSGCYSPNGNIAYVVVSPSSTYSPSMYYSSNNGTDWYTCSNQPTFVSSTFPKTILCEGNGSNVVMITLANGGGMNTYSSIYYTPDPNASAWATASVDTSLMISCGACDPSGNYYVAAASTINVGSNAGIFTSVDKGHTWTRNTISGAHLSLTEGWLDMVYSGNGTFTACSFGNTAGGYSSLSGHIVQTTTPAGAWSNVSAFNNNISEGVSFTKLAVNYDATNIFALNVDNVTSQGRLCYSIGGAPSEFDTSLDNEGRYYSSIFLNNAGLPFLISVGNDSSGGFYGLLTTGNGGAVCFMEGAQILTDDGYRAVETLRVGDNVKTLHSGYKPVVMTGSSVIYNNPTPERTREKLYIYPEGLVVTGGHSVLLEKFTDEQLAKVKKSMGKVYVTEGRGRLLAMDDDRASVYPVKGRFNIYNFALESPDEYRNYGVYANGGVLVESSFKCWLKKGMVTSDYVSASSEISCGGK